MPCKATLFNGSGLPWPSAIKASEFHGPASRSHLRQPHPMRRAAVQAFRTARRSHHARRYLSSNTLSQAHLSRVPGLRFQSTLPERGQPLPPLQSSLYFRNFALALLSSLVASGAWFAYKENPSAEKGVQVNHTLSPLAGSPILGSPNSESSFSTASVLNANSPPVTTEEAAEATRRALVVENDQFFTGDIVGDTPLSKETDASGRLILEMLTPEQATQRLRQKEQSFLVGRGQGLVRYDVVQLPSNNPIEDDHAEKIIEVPSSVTPPQDGLSSSDWMFWGVFDGHRYANRIYVHDIT